MMTHEQFIHAVRNAAVAFAKAHAQDPDEWTLIDRLLHVKLVYGRGTHGLRGVTQFNAWKHTCDTDLIEVCALGEESWIQLAGTTLHELGHVLAGIGHGHDKTWKSACAAVGLRRVHAAGTQYLLANFHPWMRNMLALMDKPTDGAPTIGFNGSIHHTKSGARIRICTAGYGTKGGKSRGAGSGSRLRKYVCGHGQIIRASTDELQAHCNVCDGPFTLELRQEN